MQDLLFATKRLARRVSLHQDTSDVFDFCGEPWRGPIPFADSAQANLYYFLQHLFAELDILPFTNRHSR